MDIVAPITADLLDTHAPSLSTSSDMPVVEVKPDAQNEGAPPAAAETKEPKGETNTPDGETIDAKTESESATDPEETSANDEPKKAKGVQKRLDELIKQREAAEGREAAERAEKLRLLALLEERRQPEQPAPETAVEVAEPVRPRREDYADSDAYEDAFIAYTDERSAWRVEQTIKAQREADQASVEQRAINEAQQAAAEQYQARITEFKAKTPDFAQVAERADVQVPTLAAAAITHSENGPALQYYFGQNPEAAANLFKLNPVQMLVEVGRIEARLTAGPSEPKPAPAPVSAAPKPITPIRSAGETATKVDPENESVDAYAMRRRKEMGWADPTRRH